MYSNNFVMCVLVNDKPQKELGNGSVIIPFNSEYSLRFRNKNKRRAVVKFFIDGECVSGNGYVIPANSFIDIERHADTPMKFKFVDLDSDDAIDFGKNGPNTDKTKGVIEARFYLEKEYVQPVTVVHEHHYHTPPLWRGYCDVRYGSIGSNHLNDGPIGLCASANNLSANFSAEVKSKSLEKRERAMYDCDHFSESDTLSRGEVQTRGGFIGAASAAATQRDGATVEGGRSSQRFSTTHIDMEDTFTTLKLFLQGVDPKVEVVKHVHIGASINPRSANIDPIGNTFAGSDEIKAQRLREENAKLELELETLRNQQLQAELEKLRSGATA